MAAGEFNTDLLYALTGVTVPIPPLRHRPDDVVLLGVHYLRFFSRQQKRQVASFSPEAVEALRQHSWPGNMRELRNVIERAMIVCRHDQIGVGDLPMSELNRVNTVAVGDPIPLERIEELHIRGVLASSPSIEAAAETLGMDTVTFWRRRKKYGC